MHDKNKREIFLTVFPDLVITVKVTYRRWHSCEFFTQNINRNSTFTNAKHE